MLVVLAIGIGFLIVSTVVFAWFVYLSGKRETAQDISDRQDLEWHARHRN